MENGIHSAYYCGNHTILDKYILKIHNTGEYLYGI